MNQSKKQILYKAVNITAVSTVITLLLFVINSLYARQDSQLNELMKVKEDIIILKQLPIIGTISNNTELVRAQSKQIDINTKTIAVLEVQCKTMDKKLDLIYGIVKDNNDKLFKHVEEEK